MYAKRLCFTESLCFTSSQVCRKCFFNDPNIGRGDPLARILWELLITSNCSQPAQNSCARVGVYFSVRYIYTCEVLYKDCGVTNPETWRTPSYNAPIRNVSITHNIKGNPLSLHPTREKIFWSCFSGNTGAVRRRFNSSTFITRYYSLYKGKYISGRMKIASIEKWYIDLKVEKQNGTYYIGFNKKIRD